MKTTLIETKQFLYELGRCTRSPDAPPRVKDWLSRALSKGLRLPERFRQPEDESYARHLLACFDSGARAVVMVWKKGQQTPLHDHAGIWCVEGVVEGRIKVISQRLKKKKGDRYKFEGARELVAEVGDAGALIPPVEHHVISNERDDLSITLHVYGGEMEKCQIFIPEGNGWYRCKTKPLSYTTSEPLVTPAQSAT